MRSTRTAATVLLCASVLLAGCSGDGDQPDGDASTPTDAADTGKAPVQKVRTCKVTGEVTGAAAAQFEGKGRAISGNNSGPLAFYEYSDQAVELSVYSKGEDFSPNVTLSVEGATYSSPSDASGLEIKTTGRRAVVDTEALGVDPGAEGVRVVADFTCK